MGWISGLDLKMMGGEVRGRKSLPFRVIYRGEKKDIKYIFKHSFCVIFCIVQYAKMHNVVLMI